MSKIKVEVKVVPAAGKTTKKTVEIDASGASVAEVLAAAGLKDTNMQVSINGVGVDNSAHVKGGGKITVTLTEKARGS